MIDSVHIIVIIIVGVTVPKPQFSWVEEVWLWYQHFLVYFLWFCYYQLSYLIEHRVFLFIFSLSNLSKLPS